MDEGGELMLRGPTVAAGYVGTEIPLQGPGGWLRTATSPRSTEKGIYGSRGGAWTAS